MHASSFPPIVLPGAKLLILGTLPGQASLLRGEYYAHPRNVFWPIVEALFGVPAAAPYAERTRRAAEAGLALWNVCASAWRPGSLDADIDPASVVAHDFAAFFTEHPGIRLVAFNGARAGELYRRLVLPGLPARWRELPRATLPSTSPAHAALPFAGKLERWSEALLPVFAGG